MVSSHIDIYFIMFQFLTLIFVKLLNNKMPMNIIRIEIHEKPPDNCLYLHKHPTTPIMLGEFLVMSGSILVLFLILATCVYADNSHSNDRAFRRRETERQ